MHASGSHSPLVRGELLGCSYNSAPSPFLFISTADVLTLLHTQQNSSCTRNHFPMRFVWFFSFINFYFLCMAILPACMSVYHVHAIPVKVRKDHPVPLGLGLVRIVSCDVGAGDRGKQARWEEQPVFLTTELALQPPLIVISETLLQVL